MISSIHHIYITELVNLGKCLRINDSGLSAWISPDCFVSNLFHYYVHAILAITQSAESVPAQPGQYVIIIPPSSQGVLPGSTQGVIRGSTQNIQYDQQSLVDSITAKVLQAIQSECHPLAFNTQSTGVADVTTVPEASTVDTSQIVSDALQNLISSEAGELTMDLPKPCLSLSNPLGATLPPALKAKRMLNLSCLLDTNQEEDISVTWISGGNLISLKCI